VQEHAGTIEVRSERGSGTTFKLVFPPAKAENRRVALN
jgi:signal transduction histidine kinase